MFSQLSFVFKWTQLVFFVYLHVALLVTSLSMWTSHVLCVAEVRRALPFLYVIPSLFFFFFFCWWCGMVCVPRRCRGERKASGWILSRRSNKSPLSRAAFCVQSANRQPEIISHNSPLRKQETLESPDDCEGAYESEREGERERERGGEREREARTGFSVFLLSSPLVLDVA